MSDRLTFTPRILRRAQIFGEGGITGLSTSAGYEQIAKGSFPRPVPLSDDENSRSVGWLDFEVYEWIEARRVARDRRTDIPLTIAPTHGAVVMVKKAPA